jgi:hypothetical protein
MVTEADSDVEICDDSTPTGVQIEEIGYDYDGDIEEDTMTGVRAEPSKLKLARFG